MCLTVSFGCTAHGFDVNAYARIANVSGSEHVFNPLDGNVTAVERFEDFHSGGWVHSFAFLSPKNAVAL